MVRLEDPSDYLTGDYASQNNINEIIPLQEGGYVNKEFTDDKGATQKKNLFEWRVMCSNGKEKIHSPNATSIRVLMKISDGDTKNLIGKKIPIIVSYSAGKYIVYVKPDLTKEAFEAYNKQLVQTQIQPNTQATTAASTGPA